LPPSSNLRAKAADDSYQKFLKMKQAALEMTPNQLPGTKKVSFSQRKAVPRLVRTNSEVEFEQQLFDLDLGNTEAADVLLALAFPLVIDPSDPSYESPESSRSSSESSGRSFSDTNSTWLSEL
jgi:hypothetical protein